MSIDQSSSGVNSREVLEAARGYRHAGLSLIPIRPDGSKAPALLTWGEFQKAIADESTIEHWFGNGHANGIAIIGGEVSGKLAVLDFEYPAEFIEFCKLVELESPGLIGSLPHVETPGKGSGPGHHLYLRSKRIISNGKLARMTAEEAKKRAGDSRSVTLVEAKGEGGYVLAPGCPAACHPSGRLYRHVGGPFIEETPILEDDQVDLLLRVAKSFDRTPAEDDFDFASLNLPGFPSDNGTSPGTDFNLNGPPIRELLGPHGWQLVRKNGSTEFWQRPGKEGKAWSATWGVCTSKNGWPLFHVFSSNAVPFAEGKSYSRFAVFALLEHAGDFSAAARALAAKGFGDGEPTKPNKGKVHEIGSVQVCLSEARKTKSGKIVGTVSVARAGNVIDLLTVTSAVSGRNDAGKIIMQHVGTGDAATRAKVDGTLGEIMAEAAQRTAKAAKRTGETLREIVTAKALEDFSFTFRTPIGAYSETRRSEIRRNDFITYTPNALVEAASEASDAPRNDQGQIVRPSLLKAVEAELKIVWSDLMRSLPVPADANMGAQTAAAAQFRQAMVKLWTKTGTWELQRDGVAERASLVSRVDSEVSKWFGTSRRANTNWQRVLRACNAWWRIYVNPAGGEVKILLALRWELTHQIGVDLPGVHDQDSLRKLGEMFGVIDPNPPVPAKVGHKGIRIAVLAMPLADNLVSSAGEDSDDECGQADRGEPSAEGNFEDECGQQCGQQCGQAPAVSRPHVRTDPAEKPGKCGQADRPPPSAEEIFSRY